jgi:hypothetical protein
VLGALLVVTPVRADDARQIALGDRPHRANHPVQRGADGRKPAEIGAASGAWWLGTVGMALVLAAVGGLSVAARRLGTGARGARGPLEVIARTSLSPRHSLYLVRAGERVLILGAGSQGPPAFLGELANLEEVNAVAGSLESGGSRAGGGS